MRSVLSAHYEKRVRRTHQSMAPKLVYRRGKREGGEEPVSKHQFRSGDGRWGGGTRGGTTEPTSRDQNTRQERGQGIEKNIKSHKEEEIIAT